MGKYNNFSINFLSKVELVPHLITIINNIKYIILEFEIFLNILG